ncbi:MAG: hypothetical protein KF708_22480 [Pirellulales bacterium]|nr:hypothetical protein [Pirellulales bacterium]
MPNTEQNIADRFRDELLEQNAEEAAQTVTEKALRGVAENIALASRVHSKMASAFKGGFSLHEVNAQFYSLGAICREMQYAPQTIRAVAKAIGAMPEFVIDGSPFWSATAYADIIDAIRKEAAKQ